MNLSANLSLLFAHVPLSQRFELAAKAGFQRIEIQFPYDLTTPQLQLLIAQNTLKLDLINLPAGDLMQGGDGLACNISALAAFNEAVELGVMYATQLGVTKVNILSGRQPLHQTDAETFEVLVNNLRYACRVLLAENIQPLIEVINPISMPRFWLQSLTRFDQLYKQLGVPELKLQFDIFHMAMLNEPILKTLEKYLPMIGHVQFADYPGRHEPGTGQLDFKSIFKDLKNKYHGTVAAEYNPIGLTEDSLSWFHLSS